jgi:hypothetical protein
MRQMAPTRTVLVMAMVALGGVPACGGQTERGSSGGPVADGAGGGFQTTPLGECKPGFPRRDSSPTRPCAWIAEDLCYDIKLAACACICPRDRPSFCISNSGDRSNPNSMIEVQCE